jgi:hypothetical protein
MGIGARGCRISEAHGVVTDAYPFQPQTAPPISNAVENPEGDK